MRWLALLLIPTTILLVGQTNAPQVEYHIYAGNTHSHTACTWSHGDHLETNGCAGILTYTKDPSSPASTWSDGYVKTREKGCAGIYVIDGSQIPAPGVTLKPDW